MAYKNLVAQTCVSPEEWFQRHRDFICARVGTFDYSLTGIGWTLFDSSYAIDENNISPLDWIVIHSAGEDGRENMFVRIEFFSTTFLKISMWLHWDASTSLGIGGTTKSYYVYFYSLTVLDIYIYGDLDSVSSFETAQLSTYGGIFGKLEDPAAFDSTVSLTTAAAIAGSSIEISVDLIPVSWGVGTSVLVVFEGLFERTTILSLTSSTITVDLVAGYAAGAVIQEHNGYIASSGYTPYPNSYNIFGHTSPPAQKVLARGPNDGSLGTIGKPDGLYGDIFVERMIVGATDYVGGYVKNAYWANSDFVAPHKALVNINGSNYRRLDTTPLALFLEV